MEYQKRMEKCHLLITEEEVKKALTKDKGSEAQLTSWKIEDFTKKGDNYAAMVTSVKVEFSLEGKEDRVSYVVKMNPCHGFQSFEDVTSAFFKKEAEFYTTLMPRLNAELQEASSRLLAMPQCYNTILEINKELIFLEDLRPRGFKMFDRRKGLDKAHATLVLKELARLHAASMLLQKKDAEYFKDTLLAKGWVNLSANEEQMITIIQGQIDSGVQMLRKVGGYDSAASWMEGLKPALKETLEKLLEPNKYSVICHGDIHNNNLLFRYDAEGHPIETMLVDLQLCRRETLAIDLNYILYTSFTGEVRKPNLEGFLEAYRSQFNAIVEAGGGEMLLEKAELMKEFRSHNVFGAIFGSMITRHLLFEPEDVPDMEVKDEEDDVNRVMEEFRQKGLDMMDTNPLMRPRFLAIFDEMMDAGLIPA